MQLIEGCYLISGCPIQLTLRSWQKKLTIIFFTIVAVKITASVTSKRLMKSQVLWGYAQEGTILRFPLLNTILVRRILLSELCTVLFRMCSSGLSHSVSQCVLNVLIFYNFLHCLACAFDMCLLNYLLTYLLTY